jgi:hypothetical protein
MSEQNHNTEASYRQFIQKVVETDAVWGLTKDDTWATSSSNEFEEAEVILFWSEDKGAVSCAEDEWATYRPESISIVEFLENWCVGMYSDALLVGPNWSSDLTGKEVEPLVMALDVIQELKAKNKTLEFTQYDSQEEFEEQVVEALEGDVEEKE